MGIIVFGPFPPPSPPPPFCQHFSTFRENHWRSSNHKWLTYGCWKIVGTHLGDLGQGHPATEAGQIFYLIPTVMWEPLIQQLHSLLGISPLSCFHLIKILEKFYQQLFSGFFFVIFPMRFWEWTSESNLEFAVSQPKKCPFAMKQKANTSIKL